MPDDVTLFGNIALSNGWIDEDALRVCLKAQQAQPRQTRLALGKIMVREGLLTAEQVAEILSAQHRMRQSHVIEGYELLAKIGSGGMGTVYKARKEGIDKIVAIKILPPVLARNQDFIKRFFREARAAGMLNHPNIVAGFDVGESGGYYYFAMEYVEGQTVGQALAKEGRMSEARALNITGQVAQALDHAATHHLVHRDIKPDNIIVTPSGVAKLADLGLAKAPSADASVTQAGHSIGTPHYCSPEQAKGSADVDIRTDIYALGATLYHMIAGKVPFAASSSAAVLAKHITEELPPIFEMKNEFSEPVARLIKKMMAKNRDGRHATPAALLEDIEHTILEIRKKRSKPLAVARPMTRRARATWHVGVLGAVVAAAVVIGAVILVPSIRSGDNGGNNTEEVITHKPDDVSTDPVEPDPKAERTARAAEALKGADAFAREHNMDFGGIAAMYEEIAKKYAGTPAAKTAATRLEQILAKRDKITQAALDKLKTNAQELAKQDKFGEAIGCWEVFAPKAKELGVHGRVDEEIRTLRQQAEQSLAEKFARATKMVADGRFDEARAVYEKIAQTFGLEKAVEKARSELAKVDQLKQAHRLKLEADARRAGELRAKIDDVSELLATFELDDARKAYEQLKRDCPEQLVPIIEEREKDLALLASLQEEIIKHINAEPNEPRKMVLRSGRSMDTTSCKADKDGLSIKVRHAETSAGWAQLTAQTLSVLAGSAAPEQPISLALLAGYSGMYKAAYKHLALAAEDEATSEQAARLKKRFESEEHSYHAYKIQQALAGAAELVRKKDTVRATKALADLEKQLAATGLAEEYGTKVAELISQNTETLAEAELEKAIAESKRGNWPAVAKSIQVLKKDFGETKTVKTTGAQKIAQLAKQCDEVYITKEMKQAIQHFIKMEDARARAIFKKIERKDAATLAKDAAAFLRVLEMEDHLPDDDCDDLLRRILQIPDPWQRILSYRTFRKRCPGSRSEACARSRIGNILLDTLGRPALAREFFLSLVNDFRRYDNWAAAGYVCLAYSEAALGNWPKAEEYHETIMKKYSDQQGVCAQALRHKADHYYALGETERAAKILETAIENYPLGGDYLSSAQLFLAKIYRDDLNKPDKALEAFKQVYFRSAKNTYLAPVAMLGAADLLIEADNKDEAKRLLYQVIDKFPESSQARTAKQKLEQL
jgi:TolA-binding protein